MSKVLQQVKPTSYIDSIARQHDIDYLRNSGSQIGTLLADAKAILSTYLTIPSLQAISLRLGLGTRSFLDLLTAGRIHFNPALKGMTFEQTRAIGEYLNNMK